jgi:hypothetical protein
MYVFIICLLDFLATKESNLLWMSLFASRREINKLQHVAEAVNNVGCVFSPCDLTDSKSAKYLLA